MIRSGLDLIILLLYAKNKEKIEGVTRLTKLLFLLVENHFKQLKKEFNFEPWDYGPWSSQVMDYLETAKDLNLIKIEERELSPLEEKDYDYIKTELEASEILELEEKKIKIFSLTKRGEKIAHHLLQKISPEDLKAIEELKKRFNKEPLKFLIEHIYRKFPQFTIKSLIKKRILPSPELEFKEKFPSSKIDKKLFKLVGILSELSVEEEKKLLKHVISERVLK